MILGIHELGVTPLGEPSGPSSTPISDTQPAFIYGYGQLSDSQNCYIGGIDTATDTNAAYIIGFGSSTGTTECYIQYDGQVLYFPITTEDDSVVVILDDVSDIDNDSVIFNGPTWIQGPHCEDD